MEVSKGAAALQLCVVVILAALGLVLGALTPWLAMSAILGMLLPIVAATVFLRRGGSGWVALGFAQAMPWKRFVGYTLAALAVIYAVTSLLEEIFARGLEDGSLSYQGSAKAHANLFFATVKGTVLITRPNKDVAFYRQVISQFLESYRSN